MREKRWKKRKEKKNLPPERCHRLSVDMRHPGASSRVDFNDIKEDYCSSEEAARTTKILTVMCVAVLV